MTPFDVADAGVSLARQAANVPASIARRCTPTDGTCARSDDDETDAESVPSREALSTGARGGLVVDFRRVARRVRRADDDDDDVVSVHDAWNDASMLTQRSSWDLRGEE